jgi:hypothetical protein
MMFFRNLVLGFGAAFVDLRKMSIWIWLERVTYRLGSRADSPRLEYLMELFSASSTNNLARYSSSLRS